MNTDVARVVGASLIAAVTACDGGSRCGNNPPCERDWICVDARCAQVCNADAACPPAERCIQGVCVEDHPTCRAHADCVVPSACAILSAAAYCEGGTCHFEAVHCVEQAPARPCMVPTGTCDSSLANDTCTGVDCCVYAPIWPEGSSGPRPSCPLGTEDANANGLLDGSEAWSGTCGHDGSCQKPGGSTCHTADVCLSGFCADGVCCDRACSGACDHCDVDGLAGTCVGCSDGYDCAGADVCLLSAGAACQAGQECASGVCAGSGVCCGGSNASCWISVDVGFRQACAVSAEGLAWCWGDDAYGKLGNDAAQDDHDVPVAVAGISNALDISAGGESTCARLEDGKAMCWGRDTFGQLGDDAALDNKSTPAQVHGLTSAVSISTGTDHTCATLSGGTAWCWGRDNFGQLGDDDTLADQSTPTQVVALESRAVSIAAGYRHSCAALDDGSAWCWGTDSSGQLGDDAAFADKTAPVRVARLDTVAAITTGYSHTCALLADGTAWCWGADNDGQLGDNETRAGQGTPVQVAGLTNVVSISAGWRHTCGLLAGGRVWCWGDDSSGELGDDAPFADKGRPVPVAGLGGAAVAVSAGNASSCAALADGTIWCWGSARDGALGNGALDGAYPLPVQVGFGRTGFAGGCSDPAECASGSCIDPFSTGTSTCWYSGAGCRIMHSDPEAACDWIGAGKYENDQLFVQLEFRAHDPLGEDHCTSGWHPGTTWEGCSGDTGTYTGVRVVLDSTGCSLFDTSSGGVLGKGGWR